jgi:glycosyltransferase involved in cell wall biosynthesis
MRIAVIGAKGLPPRQGGIEHQCAELYPRIRSLGHTVDVFARSSYTGLPWFYEDNYKGVRIISLPGLYHGGVDALTSSAIGTIASLRSNYDIVHFHALGPSLFSWLPRFVSSSTKVVVTCHGLDWQRQKWGKSSSNLILAGEKIAVRYAHGLIVVSKELRSYFRKTYNREAIYIPNAPAGYPASDPTFSYGSSLGLIQKRYIVFLGRLVPEKCPDLLIKAFQKLQLEEWKLVLVGGSSDTPSFTTWLSNLAAGNPNIIFTGQLGGSRLAEIVRDAGLFVLPSSLEGLPLAMLEAMQEGVPVIASNIPPHQQLLDEGRGMLFQPGDVESCAHCLKQAISHPQKMTIMAERARKHVQEYYNWETIVAENLRLYKTLIAEFQTSTPAANQLQKATK